MAINNTEKNAVLETNEKKETIENLTDTQNEACSTESTGMEHSDNSDHNTTIMEKQAESSTGAMIEASPEYIPLAVAKLDAELKTFSGGNKEKAVSAFVATVLTKFCSDNPRFAEVVHKTTRTLSDVCREVMAGTGNQISDFEVYRGAVQSYFPNADIHCYMSINIIGTPPTDDEIRRAPKVQAPAAPVYTPKNQAPAAPAKEPEYFETIHLEL